MEMGDICYAYEEIEKGQNAWVISGFERIAWRMLFRERRIRIIRGCREKARSERMADGVYRGVMCGVHGGQQA